MSKPQSELQKLSREVNFMKFRLLSARAAIQDTWRLIDRMSPGRVSRLSGTTFGCDYMIEQLIRRYQATKLEIILECQRGQK